MNEWQPISEAQDLRYGTIADLRMENGRVYRCKWDFKGRCCAWWPLERQARKRGLALFEPEEFRIVAEGLIAPQDWRKASDRAKAVLVNTNEGLELKR